MRLQPSSLAIEPSAPKRGPTFAIASTTMASSVVARTARKIASSHGNGSMPALLIRVPPIRMSQFSPRWKPAASSAPMPAKAI